MLTSVGHLHSTVHRSRWHNAKTGYLDILLLLWPYLKQVFFVLPDKQSDKFDRLASPPSSSHSQLNYRSNMTTEKVGGQRLLWIVTGHRGWLESRGLLKCQLDSQSVIRNPSKQLEKVCWHGSVCGNYKFVVFSSLCVQRGGKAWLVVEHCCFPAVSENSSCEAKQHLIYCCSGHAVVPQRHLAAKVQHRT